MKYFLTLLIIISLLFFAGPNQPATAKILEGCTDPGECPNKVFLPFASRLIPGKVCLTVNPKVNDNSFNQLVWQGIQLAQSQMWVTGKYLEAASTSDYPPHINTFIAEKCDLIVTVGLYVDSATYEAAVAHPEQKFTITDIAYFPPLPNLVHQNFLSEQAAFLGGYLAAGTTKTGKVGTFGESRGYVSLPYMNGFYQGVQYYNQQNSKTVQVLGWNPATNQGEFIDDYKPVTPETGGVIAQKLIGLGADIIFPVAGLAGLPAAQYIQTNGNAWVIGVDTDWTVFPSQYKSVVLTSVMKNMDVTTYQLIEKVLTRTYTGGTYTGTLANNGVGLGTISSTVPADLITELDQVKADIINGTIVVTP